MATTSLFVELIIIGVGAFSACVLVLAAAMGNPDLIMSEATALIFAFPFLSFSYVMGIIVDRVADDLFGRFIHLESHSRFDSVEDLHLAKRLIRFHSTALCSHLDYTRSRLRVCRGWSVNAVLLFLAANVWVWAHDSSASWRIWTSLVISILAVTVFYGCLFSYKVLLKKYYVQIYEKSELIRSLCDVGSIPSDNSGNAG